MGRPKAGMRPSRVLVLALAAVGVMVVPGSARIRYMNFLPIEKPIYRAPSALPTQPNPATVTDRPAWVPVSDPSAGVNPYTGVAGGQTLPTVIHDWLSLDVDRGGTAVGTYVFRWGDLRRIKVDVDLDLVFGVIGTNPGVPAYVPGSAADLDGDGTREDGFMGVSWAVLRLVGPDQNPFTYDGGPVPLTNTDERPRAWILMDYLIDRYPGDGTPDRYTVDTNTDGTMDTDPVLNAQPSTIIQNGGASGTRLTLYFDVDLTPSPGFGILPGGLPSGDYRAQWWSSALNWWGAGPALYDTWESRTAGGMLKTNPATGAPLNRFGPGNGPAGSGSRGLSATPDGVVDGYDAPLVERDRYWDPGYWTVEGIDLYLYSNPNDPADPTTPPVPAIPNPPVTATSYHPGDVVALANDVTTPAGWTASQKVTYTGDARDYFIVANPVNLEVWGDSARRFSFYGNAAEGTATLADSSAAVPANFREKAPPDADARALANVTRQYNYANGNRSFFTRTPATGVHTAPYQDSFNGYTAGGTAWMDDDVNRGLALPVLDLFDKTHGRMVEFVPDSARGWGTSAGVYIENASHIDLGSISPVGTALIRAEAAPLQIVSRVTGALGEEYRVQGRDYRGRTVPNTDYPTIPESAVQLSTYGGTDLTDGGITLPWRGSPDANLSEDGRTPPTDSAVPANYRKLDIDYPADPGVLTPPEREDGLIDGLLNEAPIRVSISIPKHQSPLSTAEIGPVSGGTLPFLYETAAPLEDGRDTDDNRRLPFYMLYEDDAGLLGTPWGTTDQNRRSTPAVDYRRPLPLPATSVAEDEAYMMRVYIDTNGNGRLDRENVEAFRGAFGAELAGDVEQRASYGWLASEPYRCFAVRVRILPDATVVQVSETVDFGTVGHDQSLTNGEPYGYAPHRKLGLRTDGNLPLGLIPSTTGGGGQLGVGFVTTHLGSDSSELGVTMPAERVEPDYVTPQLWSLMASRAGESVPSSRVFIDNPDLANFPSPFAYDPGEEAGNVRLYIGPMTPLGTYAGNGWAFVNTIDSGDPGVYDPPSADPSSPVPYDWLSVASSVLKVRVSEAPLPPRFGFGNLPYDPYIPDPADPADPGAPADQNQVDRANVGNLDTNWVETDPTVIVHLATDGSGTMDNLPIPSFTRDDLQVEMVFSSNRPRPGSSDTGYPRNWNLWHGQMAPPAAPDPFHPVFVPEAPTLYAEDPVAEGVNPPEPAFPNLESWRHYGASFDQTGDVLAWVLSSEWEGGGQVAVQQHIGVSSRAGNFNDKIYFRIDAHRPEGVRPFIADVGDPLVDGLYLFYYAGSGNNRRVYYAKVIDTAGTADDLSDDRLVGPVELRLMRQNCPRYEPSTTGVTAAGTEFSAEPWVFADRYLDAGQTRPCVGILFSGRSLSKGDDDIFYARLRLDHAFGDPERYARTAAGPFDAPSPLNPATTLSYEDPRLPFDREDHQGEVRVATEDEVLAPLPEGTVGAGESTTGAAQTAVFASRHVDWRWGWPVAADDGDTDPNTGDPAGGNWIEIRVQEFAGGAWADVAGQTWDTFTEDPATGLLFAMSPNGVRAIEIDPAAGLVRFNETRAQLADPSTVPAANQRVLATYTARALRLTTSSFDEGQPAATIMPWAFDRTTDEPEVIHVPASVLDPGAQDPDALFDFIRPERLMLLFTRKTAQGQHVLYYQTLSVPLDPDDNTPYDERDPTWMFDDDNDRGKGDVWFPYQYTDSGPTAVPLERNVHESRVAPVAMPYVWWTRSLQDSAGVYLSAFRDFLTDSGLSTVVGPTTVWLFYATAAPHTPVDPESGAPVHLPDEGTYAADAPGDLDIFYGALSPRTIPTYRQDVDLSGIGT